MAMIVLARQENMTKAIRDRPETSQVPKLEPQEALEPQKEEAEMQEETRMEDNDEIQEEALA